MNTYIDMSWDMRFLFTFVVLFVGTLIYLKVMERVNVPREEYRHNWKRSRYSTYTERRGQ